MSRQRDQLGQDLTFLGFTPEVRFIEGRRHRFDWARSDLMLAVEYQGIIGKTHGYGDASHASIAGMLRDHWKISEAQIRGWVVILANAKNVDDGTVYDQINRAMAARALTETTDGT